jgi:hypothetical protein
MVDENDFFDVFHQVLKILRLEVSLISQNNKAIENQPQSQPSTSWNNHGERYVLHCVCCGKNEHESKACMIP